MNPYSAYAAADKNVDGDNKPKLLLKVYQSMLDNIDIVKAAIEKKNFEKKYEGLTKLTLVLEILDASLDMSQGEISKNLSDLYQYLQKRLASVHMSLDTAVLCECRSIMSRLHEGFIAACDKEAKEKVMAQGNHDSGPTPFTHRVV